MSKTDQNERLIDAIDKLAFVINNAQQTKDYSPIFTDIIVGLKEIGNGYNNDGCLKKIYQELRLLNKTLIMSALILGATKNPEKTLNNYKNIIDEYIN